MKAHTVCFATAFVSLAASAPAQGAGERDSLRALFDAKAALQVFERRWRTEIAGQVPVSTLAPFADCEFRIGTGYCYGPGNGRLAYTHQGTTPNADRFAPDVIPRPARRKARALVNELLASLKKARGVIPGDQWIAGQLVRLNLERADPNQAMEEAIECASTPWWCGALRGHVFHMIGLEKLADSVWTDALYFRMSLDERCLWLDPTDVIRSDSLRRVVAGMSCAERVTFAERAWWLSDPLHLTPENERRSEHLSRQVAILLDAFSNQRLDSAYVDMIVRGLRQTSDEERRLSGSDLASLFRNDPPDITLPRVFAPAPLGYEELVRRLGVPGFFHITRPEPGFSPQLVALLPTPRFSFVPAAHALVDQTRASPTDWKVAADDQYEFHTMPEREFVDLEYQVAFFKRGDSARLVAATDLERQPRLARNGSTAALVLRQDFRDTALVLRRPLRGDLYIESASIPAGRTHVSMEVVSRDGRLAGRVRFGAGPPDMPAQRVTISDMLVLEDPVRLPAGLDDAASHVIGTTRVGRKAIGVFWEMYGLRAGEKAQITVAVTRDQPGGVAAVARRITGQRFRDQVTTAWEDVDITGRAVEPRSVSLPLATLSPGRYTLSVAVGVEGQQPVRTSRVIEIIER